KTVAHCVGLARAGEGPTIIEATTERLVGHYIGDAQTYRSPGELEAALTREPIARAEGRLRSAGVPEDELAADREAVLDEVTQSAARALEAPLADPTTVRRYLYA